MRGAPGMTPIILGPPERALWLPPPAPRGVAASHSPSLSGASRWARARGWRGSSCGSLGGLVYCSTVRWRLRRISDSEEFIHVGDDASEIDPALQRRKIRYVDQRPLSGSQIKLTRGEDAQQRVSLADRHAFFAARAQRHGVQLLRIRAVPCHALGLWVCG